MKFARLFVVATFLFATTAAHSFDFKSIGDAPTILYDTPSHFGIKRFVAPPGMPLEVVHTAHGWSKVRDVYGDLTWVESPSLSNARTVVVTADQIKVRQQPESDAKVVFTTEKGVLLNIAAPIDSQWIKVLHKDGLVGYVQANEVWGH